MLLCATKQKGAAVLRRIIQGRSQHLSFRAWKTALCLRLKLVCCTQPGNNFPRSMFRLLQMARQDGKLNLDKVDQCQDGGSRAQGIVMPVSRLLAPERDIQVRNQMHRKTARRLGRVAAAAADMPSQVASRRRQVMLRLTFVIEPGRPKGRIQDWQSLVTARGSGGQDMSCSVRREAHES